MEKLLDGKCFKIVYVYKNNVESFQVVTTLSQILLLKIYFLLHFQEQIAFRGYNQISSFVTNERRSILLVCSAVMDIYSP